MGIDVLLEPLNGRDVPGYLLDDFDRAAALIRRLGLLMDRYAEPATAAINAGASPI